MQTTLFESEQYVATPVPGVKPEHAECERLGFAWEMQTTFFAQSSTAREMIFTKGPSEQAICSRCQTVRPYDTERAS